MNELKPNEQTATQTPKSSHENSVVVASMLHLTQIAQGKLHLNSGLS